MNVFDKAKIIISLYEDNQLTQAEVSKRLNISVYDVQKVTQACGYRRGNRVNSDNGRESEEKKIICRYEDLKCLEKYPDENFREYM